MFSLGTHACIWFYVLINVCVQVCAARLCDYVGACASIHVCPNVCACVLAGQSAIVQQRPQGLLLPQPATTKSN